MGHIAAAHSTAKPSFFLSRRSKKGYEEILLYKVCLKPWNKYRVCVGKLMFHLSYKLFFFKFWLIYQVLWEITKFKSEKYFGSFSCLWYFYKYSTHGKFGNTASVSALLTRRLTGQSVPTFSAIIWVITNQILNNRLVEEIISFHQDFFKIMVNSSFPANQ